MESCLQEATQLLSDHNPDLMKEFEKLFSQSAAAAAGSMFPQQPMTTPTAAQTSQSNASIDDTLEQAFQQMKQNKPQKVWSYSSHDLCCSHDPYTQFDMDTLNEMFSGVDLSSVPAAAAGDVIGDEDDLMGMMQSMMDSLLSKDVLYPSLQAICQKVILYDAHCPIVYCIL